MSLRRAEVAGTQGVGASATLVAVSRAPVAFEQRVKAWAERSPSRRREPQRLLCRIQVQPNADDLHFPEELQRSCQPMVAAGRPAR